MPKVSVIVPVYNVEKYLDRCINSILHQTFTDFELILVDDGSPDNCGKICDEYARKDNRVVVIHKQNAGVSAARNTGIDKACGEYIMFVDSDDYIDAKMLEGMLSNSSADIIFCGLQYVDTNKNIIKKCVSKEFYNIDRATFTNEHFLSVRKKSIINGPCNKLLKKVIIESNNIRFNEELSICEDGLFVMHFLHNCATYTNIDSSYYNYVQYSSGTLMWKYNENAFEANEMLYNSTINFLEPYDSAHIIKKEIDSVCLNRFIAFFSYIYSRSGLTNKEKYCRAKKAIENELFKKLLLTAQLSWKAKLIRLAVKTHCILPLHLLYCLRWKK